LICHLRLKRNPNADTVPSEERTMTAIDPKIPSLPVTRPANSPNAAKADTARVAWREEMLGELLGKMREHKLPQSDGETPRTAERSTQGKGLYINIYV
jgi:hypothetical protein